MPLEFEDRPAIGDSTESDGTLRTFGAKILVAAGIFAVLIAALWVLGFVGGSGVLASLRLADGSEYLLTQSNNHQLFEPSTVAFYLRPSSTAPWGWCYVDHQARRWSKVAMTYDAAADAVVITEKGTRRACLDRRRGTFWIDNGSIKRELPAPQERGHPPDYSFPGDQASVAAFTAPRRWMNLKAVRSAKHIRSPLHPMNLMPLVVVALLLVPGGCFAGVPTARPADVVAPGDLGIVKCVFEGSPEAGQVLVLRREKYLNDRLVETYENISNTNGAPHSDAVVLIDRSFLLPEARPQLLLRAPGSAITLDDASLKRWESGGDRLTLEIETKQGSVKYVFRVMQESYAAANERHPSLPPSSDRWSFGGFAGKDEAARTAR